jgi:hypothetical protein
MFREEKLREHVTLAAGKEWEAQRDSYRIALARGRVQA